MPVIRFRNSVTHKTARRKPGGFSATALRRQIALIVFGLASMQGCASLPETQAEMTEIRPMQVAFESTRGQVSTARSEAIIDKMENKAGATDILDKHLAYEQVINDTPLVMGNKLRLLLNGPDTYAAMFAAIRAAKDHINLETYIFDDDEAGQKFAALLLERQAAGVQVNIIHDSVGTLGTPSEFFERMRAAGMKVLEFNPVNPLATKGKDWQLNNRDHRKQMIVDGRVVFTGGINISSAYSSRPFGKSAPSKPDPSKGWRDTHIQIDGPVVAEFQKLFMETWTRQKGEPLPERNYFPKLTPQGDEIVRAIGSTPENKQAQIYRTLISAIRHAERNIHLTIAYFAPNPEFLKALTDAAQRGVEVRLVLPSITDSSAIFHLGRSHYTDLLEAGVQIFERRGSVMHAKTASIDSVWSTVGSTNLDWRSFLHNDELNAVILGRDFARQMEKVFAHDLAESDQILLKKWKNRSLLLRLREQLSRLGAYWM